MTTQRKPTGLQWLWGMKDFPEYEDYRKRGGDLSYNQWSKQGKPKAAPSLQPEWLTSKARKVMGTPEYAENVARLEAGLPLSGERPAFILEKEETEKGEAEKKRAETAFEKKEREKEEREERWRTKEFEEKQRQFDVGQRIKTYTAFGINPFGVPDNPETPDVEGWNKYTGQWEQPPGWISPEAQGRLDLQKAQMEQSARESADYMAWQREEAGMRQQEQERQYKSQLMANPMSWLQYSAYTGEVPRVQEWMKPLMSQQYQTGQQIPGWMGGQGEGQAMGSLPELRTPSAQLWARMGPTAQQQYMGYGQARTGIRPEETVFRLRATAPPSGGFGGLRRMR